MLSPGDLLLYWTFFPANFPVALFIPAKASTDCKFSQMERVVFYACCLIYFLCEFSVYWPFSSEGHFGVLFSLVDLCKLNVFLFFFFMVFREPVTLVVKIIYYDALSIVLSL